MFGLHMATIVSVLHTSSPVTLLTPAYQQTAVTKQKRRPENVSGTKIRPQLQITKVLEMAYPPKALSIATASYLKHQSTTRYHPWTRRLKRSRVVYKTI
jgi:hypothetical protein